MLLSIISLFVVEFPLAYIFSQYTSMELNGIWIAFPITNILVALGAYFLYKKGAWNKKKVTEDINLTDDMMAKEL